ncbi:MULTISPECIES: hypothetical protein [Flavobacterium]|uniref:hypothetical protein n=1 Tax=Flavobacterium TaxID=237 RepID=UPI0021145084|nr:MULTISPECIES: hypothetical protein [Flavobacterium]UUF16148.1 hypothetical protein NLJ00_08500 [Flavobacterium panici]
MKKTIATLFLSITCFLMGCGNDEKKQQKRKTIYPVDKLTPASAKTLKKTPLKTIGISKDLAHNSATNKRNHFSSKKESQSRPLIQNQQVETENANLNWNEEENKSLVTFGNLKKILSLSKIGQTLNQKQLTENFEIPKEAVKLVKSITKTSEDEIAIKWRSTWFIEKVSDAKFKDGLMKITFKANKLYTSGTAIGIKYDKKIHNELIIIGRSAYIPGVEGYSWQIGK